MLIAGSSGFLGTRLRERLQAEGHQVTPLVRRPPEDGEIRWDPYAAPLGHEVVDNADVVVNLAGAPTIGNPHSKKWREDLYTSRITTTRVIAEAIAASESKPVFLAQNAIAYYGDHGAEVVTEATAPRGDSMMGALTRDWQAATEPAAASGARVVVMRTVPVLDRRSGPLNVLQWVFKAGLGGPLGDGRQYFPVISTRDWVDAAIALMTSEVEGPVNMVAPHTPTNAEFTEALAHRVHRPAFFRVPAFAIKAGAGRVAPELLNSVRAEPRVLLDAGYTFHDPDITAIIDEALDPRP